MTKLKCGPQPLKMFMFFSIRESRCVQKSMGERKRERESKSVRYCLCEREFGRAKMCLS